MTLAFNTPGWLEAGGWLYDILIFIPFLHRIFQGLRESSVYVLLDDNVEPFIWNEVAFTSF